MKTYATTERALIDLSLAENPLGCSPNVKKAIIKAAKHAHNYPDQEKELIALIAGHHRVSEETILLGAGANQLLEEYLKVFALGKSIAVPAASFPESVGCMATLRGSVDYVSLLSNHSLNLNGLLRAVSPKTALIHLCNPNNPTGIWTEPCRLLQLAEQSPVPLLVSEAGADFVGQTLIDRSMPSNLIIVRSFSKAYGLAGLRIGYSVASREVVVAMKGHLRSYRVSSIAIAAAIAAMQDQAHLHRSIAYILREKAWLMRELSALGFKTVPSQGQNFIARVPANFKDAAHFCRIAKQHGLAVVNCSLYPGMEHYIRVSPQKRQINKKFIKEILCFHN